MANLQSVPDKLLQVIFVGDDSVGKTCIINRISSDKFDSNCRATIGCEFVQKELELEGKKVRLRCWDTPSQDRFQAIVSNYYRRADGVVYVYDVTQRRTFEVLRDHWTHRVAEHSTKLCAVLILANKIDLAARREVATEEGAEFARQHGWLYQEVSAKADEGVYDAFMWALVFKMLEGGSGNVPVGQGERQVRLGQQNPGSRRDGGGLYIGSLQ